MRDAIPQNILNALQDLPDGLQQQVLEYLQSLEHSTQPGDSGQSWPGRAGARPADDSRSRRAAIDLDCGQVDSD